jgi:hypothetical protein
VLCSVTIVRIVRNDESKSRSTIVVRRSGSVLIGGGIETGARHEGGANSRRKR